ncbi:MAG: hypothetical protein H6Q51_2274 [Deltaproteobacteria bacterium]|nr:hypothetical protein [Deltaproteobacteria bacterium]
MSEADELNTIVAEWVEKAEADLACAAHLLRIKAEWSAETICFHAQQLEDAFPEGRSGGEGDAASKDRQLLADPGADLNVLTRLMLRRPGAGTT